MKFYSEQAQNRVLGQRSLASSFIFRSSYSRLDSKKGSCSSLSDFLDQKLHRNTTTIPPKKVQRKARPFSSPITSRYDDVSVDHCEKVKNDENGKCATLGENIFDQFKHTSTENGSVSCLSGEYERGTSSISFGTGTCKANITNATRKRTISFQSVCRKVDTQQHSLAYGEDPNDKQKRRQNFISNKRPRRLYNHYANGSGWWDGDMEGIDTEEVGSAELWEGVGSTTFGDSEWH
ncbi:hypothetical protein K2173_003753 [Erythroxylum novogranatense]|uniref:Uncharacterized protein n=1 Tax=Erythroxylum novogranatense TaxID=1862640 RepID=A0AAV8TAZ0_9ROSI|nr:hypothetical protein K2173_003753 [Erythroxylum novogranatense]